MISLKIAWYARCTPSVIITICTLTLNYLEERISGDWACNYSRFQLFEHVCSCMLEGEVCAEQERMYGGKALLVGTAVPFGEAVREECL